MEKISIGKSKTLYEIESISPMSANVLQIVFADTMPKKYGDITILTAGGIECATLPGYDTVWRDEGQTVYLSNDGSVYVPPADPAETDPPEPHVPTLAELRAAKKTEVNIACNSTIVAGFGVTLSDGTGQRFSLKEEDQIALMTCASMVQNGEDAIPWHPNGDTTQPCAFYSNEDMHIITAAAYFHRSYHTTYCNALKVWADACTEADQLSAIYYGADVPEEYQSEVLQAYLAQIRLMGGIANETTS